MSLFRFMALPALLIAAGSLAGRPAADLRVQVFAVAETRAGDEVVWTASVENLGPDDSENIAFATLLRRPGHGVMTRCKNAIPQLAPGASYTLTCRAVTRAPPYELTVESHATSNTPDPLPANNLADSRVKIMTSTPDLVVLLRVADESRGADAGHDASTEETFDLEVIARNDAWVDATGASVVVDLPSRARFHELPPACCTVEPHSARCEVAVGGARLSEGVIEQRLKLRVTVPDDAGVPLFAAAAICANESDYDVSNNTAVVEVPVVGSTSEVAHRRRADHET